MFWKIVLKTIFSLFAAVEWRNLMELIGHVAIPSLTCGICYGCFSF